MAGLHILPVTGIAGASLAGAKAALDHTRAKLLEAGVEIDRRQIVISDSVIDADGTAIRNATALVFCSTEVHPRLGPPKRRPSGCWRERGAMKSVERARSGGRETASSPIRASSWPTRRSAPST